MCILCDEDVIEDMDVLEFCSIAVELVKSGQVDPQHIGNRVQKLMERVNGTD